MRSEEHSSVLKPRDVCQDFCGEFIRTRSYAFLANVNLDEAFALVETGTSDSASCSDGVEALTRYSICVTCAVPRGEEDILDLDSLDQEYASYATHCQSQGYPISTSIIQDHTLRFPAIDNSDLGTTDILSYSTHIVISDTSSSSPSESPINLPTSSIPPVTSTTSTTFPSATPNTSTTRTPNSSSSSIETPRTTGTTFSSSRSSRSDNTSASSSSLSVSSSISTPSSTPSSSISPTPNPDPKTKQSTSHIPAIIGAVLGLIIIILLVFIFWHRRRRKRQAVELDGSEGQYTASKRAIHHELEVPPPELEGSKVVLELANTSRILYGKPDEKSRTHDSAYGEVQGNWI
ncbi:hypothetical protein F5Y18DRAFT_439559 [Xylariaceae sp. FL1019]|nr:hypothetical protein F5Y18DRAFT_439559 [Xylariaceae sp. FL1019]